MLYIYRICVINNFYCVHISIFLFFTHMCLPLILLLLSRSIFFGTQLSFFSVFIYSLCTCMCRDVNPPPSVISDNILLETVTSLIFGFRLEFNVPIEQNIEYSTVPIYTKGPSTRENASGMVFLGDCPAFAFRMKNKPFS